MQDWQDLDALHAGFKLSLVRAVSLRYIQGLFRVGSSIVSGLFKVGLRCCLGMA